MTLLVCARALSVHVKIEMSVSFMHIAQHCSERLNGGP